MVGMIRSKSSRQGPVPYILRILAFCMVLVLLTVRLGSFSEEVFVTPLEDAIFDVAIVSADETGPQTKPQAVKSKRTLDCDLMQYEIPLRRPAPVVAAVPMHVSRIHQEDIAFEIFIPPESVV